MKTGTRTQVPHDYNWPLPLLRYGWMIIVKLLFIKAENYVREKEIDLNYTIDF